MKTRAIIFALLLPFAAHSVEILYQTGLKPPAFTHAPNHVLVRFKPEAREAVAVAHEPRKTLSALLQELRLPQGAELQEPGFTRWAWGRFERIEDGRMEDAGSETGVRS